MDRSEHQAGVTGRHVSNGPVSQNRRTHVWVDGHWALEPHDDAPQALPRSDAQTRGMLGLTASTQNCPAGQSLENSSGSYTHGRAHTLCEHTPLIPHGDPSGSGTHEPLRHVLQGAHLQDFFFFLRLFLDLASAFSFSDPIPTAMAVMAPGMLRRERRAARCCVAASNVASSITVAPEEPSNLERS